MSLKDFLSNLFKSEKTDLTDFLPDGLVLIDEDGDFIMTNNIADKMLSDIKEEFQNYNINDIFENAIMLIKKVAETGKQVVLKTNKDTNKDLFFEFTARKHDKGYLVLMRENTQNYKTLTNIFVEYESSKKINRNKNAFLVNLSSDLKNPLQSSIGFSKALLDGLCGKLDDKTEKYIKIIHKNSGDLLYLIDKMIELSRTESGLIAHNPQYFDCIDVLRGCLKHYEQYMADKNIKYNLEVQDDIKRTIYSEDELLKSIINNILECAIKSTQDGTISVSVRYPDKEILEDKSLVPQEDSLDKGFLLFEFTDTGAGLTQEELDNIFEPYIEVERPNRKDIVNSISFLSVKNLIKILKGNMWLESEPEKGTIYSFIIPTEKASQAISNE